MIYTKKIKDGVEVYKARMCALGNRQIEGVDYFKHHVYSPVINSREIHVSLSLAAANDWNIHQSDITQGLPMVLWMSNFSFNLLLAIRVLQGMCFSVNDLSTVFGKPLLNFTKGW